MKHTPMSVSFMLHVKLHYEMSALSTATNTGAIADFSADLAATADVYSLMPVSSCFGGPHWSQ